MDTLQNVTKTENQNGSQKPDSVTLESDLTERQERYITYKAVGGLSVEIGQPSTKVSMQEFADSIGVSRKQLYVWQGSYEPREHGIPNFWERVKNRRQAI